MPAPSLKSQYQRRFGCHPELQPISWYLFRNLAVADLLSRAQSECRPIPLEGIDPKGCIK